MAYYKATTQGQPNGRDALNKVWGGGGLGLSFPLWCAFPTPSTSMYSPIQKLSEPCDLGALTKALLGGHKWLNCWLGLINLISSPLPSLEVWGGGGSKVPTLQSKLCRSSSAKSHQPTEGTLRTQEIPRVLEALVPGTKDKDQIYISYYIATSHCATAGEMVSARNTLPLRGQPILVGTGHRLFSQVCGEEGNLDTNLAGSSSELTQVYNLEPHTKIAFLKKTPNYFNKTSFFP